MTHDIVKKTVFKKDLVPDNQKNLIRGMLLDRRDEKARTDYANLMESNGDKEVADYVRANIAIGKLKQKREEIVLAFADQELDLQHDAIKDLDKEIKVKQAAMRKAFSPPVCDRVRNAALKVAGKLDVGLPNKKLVFYSEDLLQGQRFYVLGASLTGGKSIGDVLEDVIMMQKSDDKKNIPQSPAYKELIDNIHSDAFSPTEAGRFDMTVALAMSMRSATDEDRATDMAEAYSWVLKNMDVKEKNQCANTLSDHRKYRIAKRIVSDGKSIIAQNRKVMEHLIREDKTIAQSAKHHNETPDEDIYSYQTDEHDAILKLQNIRRYNVAETNIGMWEKIVLDAADKVQTYSELVEKTHGKNALLEKYIPSKASHSASFRAL